MINRRVAFVAAVALVFIWSVKLLPVGGAWQSARQSLASTSPAADYYEQVFSVDHPRTYRYATLQDACDRADWDHNEAYLNCVGIEAGLTSIISQVKVCLKMAVETGSHLVLPRMPLRDSKNLLEFNFFNEAAYMPYDQWFDADHLREQLGRVCPRMRVLHPDDLNTNVAVAHRFAISCGDAFGYTKLQSYFWVGRPFATFFADQFSHHMEEIRNSEAQAREAAPPSILPSRTESTEAYGEDEDNSKGITVVDTDSEFMVFRLTDDPTRRDLRLWTDLSYLVRFRQDVRDVVARIAPRLPPPGSYYGVHFRAENDSIWSSVEHQLAVDLDALDRAWAKFGSPSQTRPPVYLACGDAVQVERFVAAGAERGWEVTHKWRLAKLDGDTQTTDLIDAMAFDFQGGIDLAIMIRSGFFIGVQGSAFSSTIANQRDVTGRYRGSSFDIADEGARTHLFNDLDANEYACCL